MNEKLMGVLVTVGLILWLAPVVNLLIVAFCYAMGIPCWNLTEGQIVVSIVWLYVGFFTAMSFAP